jgi:hypothetical protein
MAQPSSQSVDPLLIFKQANSFYQTLAIVCNVEPGNVQLAATIGDPVVGALTVELFLKCLICIETGKAPHGHHLRELFDQLSETKRARIQRTWNTADLQYFLQDLPQLLRRVVVEINPEWKQQDKAYRAL